MKKFISGLFAALLLTAGFVSLSGQAQAAPSVDCGAKYTTCFATKVAAKGDTATAGQHATVRVKVRAAGNVAVKGKLTLTVDGKTVVRRYRNTARFVRLPVLAEGTHKVKVAFTPVKTANLKPSQGKATVVIN